MISDYLPVFFQALVAIGFAAVALVLSSLLGKRARRTEVKDSAYECGMIAQGDGAPRFSIKFYLVAMLFVIFDIEVVFIYPWALAFKDLITESATALLSMSAFAGVLTVAYLYALRKGVFNWNA